MFYIVETHEAPGSTDISAPGRTRLTPGSQGPMESMNGIKIRAVLIALFAFYIAPIVPLTVITSAQNFFGAADPIGQRIPIWQSAASLMLLWFWAVAPVGSGYLAAKIAGQQPLFHGLIAGIIGGLFAVLWGNGMWAFELALALLVISCGLFGGWLWRCRSLTR